MKIKYRILIGVVGAVLILVGVFAFNMADTEHYGARSLIPSKYSYVAEYLSQDSDITYMVSDVSFQHYEEGIAGGLYIYDFTLKGSDGSKHKANYTSYLNLSKDTVQDVTME